MNPIRQRGCRRQAWALFLLLGLCSLAAVAAPASAGPQTDGAPGKTLRIGLTPVFLDDQEPLLSAWRDYLVRRLGRPVRFVQRASYREITELLRRGELDFAWLCGFPYIQNRRQLELVAVPLYRGSPLYQSYLIVGRDHPGIDGWADLEGLAFAYSDPHSNSGYLYPRVAMQRAGLEPARLFRRSFFVWGHRNVIEAVASGLADAGAVDGYVWESLAKAKSDLTEATRVVRRSPWFGFPPVVAGPAADGAVIRQFRRLLVAMADDEAGAALLARLNLDGFATAEESLYDNIAGMAAELRAGGAGAR